MPTLATNDYNEYFYALNCIASPAQPLIGRDTKTLNDQIAQACEFMREYWSILEKRTAISTKSDDSNNDYMRLPPSREFKATIKISSRSRGLPSPYILDE